MTDQTATQLLEALTQAYARLDLILLDKKAAIPAEVQATLDEIEEEYSPKIEAATAQIEELKAQVTEAVTKEGASVKGGALQAVYSKGRISWDGKKLDGMMSLIPQLKDARKEGDPTVSIRKIS